jgi:hypothetical protein
VAAAGQERSEQGTTVTLVPRRGEEHWLRRDAAIEIVSLYGSMLPIPVHVGDTLITSRLAPWDTDAGGRNRVSERYRSRFLKRGVAREPCGAPDLSAGLVKGCRGTTEEVRPLRRCGGPGTHRLPGG